MSSRRTPNAPSAQQAAPAVLSSYAAPAPTPVASASPDAKFTVHDVMAVAGMVADFMNDVEARSKLREEKEAMISELADNGYDLSAEIGAFGFGHDDEDDDLDHLTSMIAARLGVPTEEISGLKSMLGKGLDKLTAKGGSLARRARKLTGRASAKDKLLIELETARKKLKEEKKRKADFEKNPPDDAITALEEKIQKLEEQKAAGDAAAEEEKAARQAARQASARKEKEARKATQNAYQGTGDE